MNFFWYRQSGSSIWCIGFQRMSHRRITILGGKYSFFVTQSSETVSFVTVQLFSQWVIDLQIWFLKTKWSSTILFASVLDGQNTTVSVFSILP